MTETTVQTETEILPCGLTKEQVTEWNETNSMFMWQAPGFQHLFYKLLNYKAGEYTALMTRSCKYAATDAVTIMVNPDNFFKFKVAGRTFILGHEVVHNVYDDVAFLRQCLMRGFVPMMDGTQLPMREDIMQKAMDLRINALLIKSRIGSPPKDENGKVVGHYDPTMTGEENLLDVYKKTYEEDKDKPQEGEGNPGGFDSLMKPGASTGQQPDAAAQKRSAQQWAVEVAVAKKLEVQNKGDLSAALSRMFQKILEPEVAWIDHITTLINRIGGSGGWNYKQPDEWWIAHDFFVPRRTGRGAGWIVIWGDTSGSRDDQEIASNIGETGGIIEDVNPIRLTMIWGDAEIGRIEELSSGSDLRELKPVGGGGTSVKPIFDWINKQGEMPDLFIGFTDGGLSFPTPPNIPIIWASSTEAKYPYGQVVRVNRRPERP